MEFHVRTHLSQEDRPIPNSWSVLGRTPWGGGGTSVFTTDKSTPAISRSLVEMMCERFVYFVPAKDGGLAHIQY